MDASARDRRRRTWAALLLVTLLLHVVALYTPGSPSPAGPPGVDKLIHLLLFGAPTLAAVLHGGWVRRWVPPMLLAHAVLSELIQAAWIPHRSGDPLDAAADAAGVALGWYIGRRLSRGAGPTPGLADAIADVPEAHRR